AWSYELLDETEQRLFSQLAVFVGGFTLDAAERVSGADLDTVTSLVEKSLIRQGDERLRMLETIREFALERLEESRELEHVRRRHADFFLAFAGREASEAERQTPAWLDLLETEHDNLRAALQFARELDDPRLKLRLASALAAFWAVRGHLREGLELVRVALGRDPGAPADIRGTLFRLGAILAVKMCDSEIV